MKINEIYGFPHFHSDLQWWKSEEGYAEDIEEILLKAIEFLDKDEDFKFTIDQVSALKPFIEAHPEKKMELSNYVDEGRIELVGGTLTAPDENIPTGEGLIRNFLYGRKYLQKEFDVKPKVAWEIDEFGHPYQLPQILKKSGFEYFGFARGVQPWNADHDLDFFWEAPDGSKILAHWLAGSYTGMTGMLPLSSFSSTQRMADELKNRVTYEGSRASVDKLLVPFGTDFSVPMEEWLDFSEVWNSQREEEFSLATPTDFFEEIEDENLKTVKEKEYNPVFTGCYESREKIKKKCRETQTEIVRTEKFATISHFLGKEYPAEKLESAWKYILKNDSHDTICGTETDKLYRDVSMKRYEFAENLISEVLEESLDFLLEEIDTSGEGEPFVVFNSLNWEREDIVSINLPEENREFVIKNSEGDEISSQIDDGQIFFKAKVPSFGYEVYFLQSRERKEEKDTNLEGSEKVLENQYYRIKIDSEKGCITSLYDKEIEKEILTEDAEYYGNEIITKEDVGNLWTIQEMGEKLRSSEHQTEIELTKDGPLIKTVKIQSEGENLAWVQKISLYSDMRKIDFETSIDFDGKNRRVQVVFEPDIDGNNYYETPFYTAERKDGHWPAQNWVDISNDDYGFAVLNKGNPGYEVEEGLLSMTLFRSVSVLPARFPGLLLKNFKDFTSRLIDSVKMSLQGLYVGEWALYPYHGLLLREYASQGGPELEGGWTLIDHLIPFLKFWEETESWERGHHSFEYSIYPHEGSWEQSNVVRKGHEKNNSLIVKKAESDEGDLPSEFSFLETDEKSIIISAFKKSEDGEEITARFYEPIGEDKEFVLSLFEKMGKARSVSMTEEETYEALDQEGKNFDMEIGGNEIKTLIFKPESIKKK